MFNTEFVEGVKALIGTPYTKCDCKDVIAKPLGIRFAGTNWLWRSIENSRKYRYLVSCMQSPMPTYALNPGDILFRIRQKVPDGYDDKPDAYHVAVYIGNGKIVHSSPSTGVREDDYVFGAWQGWGRMKQVEYRGELPETVTEMTDHEMIKALYEKFILKGED